MATPARLTEQKQTTVSLAKAKATFSAVIDNVEQRRIPITILRRGVPVAQIVPVENKPFSLRGSMRGTVTELGDVVGPTGEEWTLHDESI